MYLMDSVGLTIFIYGINRPLGRHMNPNWAWDLDQLYTHGTPTTHQQVFFLRWALCSHWAWMTHWAWVTDN